MMIEEQMNAVRVSNSDLVAEVCEYVAQLSDNDMEAMISILGGAVLNYTEWSFKDEPKEFMPYGRTLCAGKSSSGNIDCIVTYIGGKPDQPLN